MNPRPGGRLFPVLASLVLALFLTITPMPLGFEDYRPQWVVLTIIYWGIRQPERVGVFWAFGAGLLLDVISGSLLGQQTLGLSVVGYAVALLQTRISRYPLWQQSFLVWVLLLVERLVTLWVLGATGQPMPTLSYWTSSIVGMLVWPLLSVVLGSFDRRARMR